MANGYDVNAVASALKSILETRNNPAANLAQVAYNASLRANPPIYVVPDRPQYGAEPVKGPQQYLGEMLSSIEAHRMKNPVYMPFEPGTPTLAGKQFEAQQAAQDFSREVTEAELTGLYKGKPTLDAQRLAITAAKSGGSGGGTERPLDPQKTLEQMAFERYVKGEATQDDLVILGLMNRPSPPSSTKQEAQDEQTRQLMLTMGSINVQGEKEAKKAIDEALRQKTDPAIIEQSINSYFEDLIADGISPYSLLEYLRIKARPWWQKAIDVVIPGEQYR